MKRSIDRATLERLVAIVGDCHDEAVTCAKAGAFRGACVMVGAALEGALLVTAIALEPQLKAAGYWPAGRPLDWGLGKLLGVAIQAGWLPQTASATPANTSISKRRS